MTGKDFDAKSKKDSPKRKRLDFGQIRVKCIITALSSNKIIKLNKWSTIKEVLQFLRNFIFCSKKDVIKHHWQLLLLMRKYINWRLLLRHLNI